jgi:hypothetical protein
MTEPLIERRKAVTLPQDELEKCWNAPPRGREIRPA